MGIPLIEDLHVGAAHLTNALSVLTSGGKQDSKWDYRVLLGLDLMAPLLRVNPCLTPNGCAEPPDYRHLMAEDQELPFLHRTLTAHLRFLVLWASTQCWDLHHDTCWILSLRAAWGGLQLLPSHCFCNSNLSSTPTSTAAPTSLSWNSNPRLRHAMGHFWYPG